jgi:nucleoside-diphosphate-sugar epimerase
MKILIAGATGAAGRALTPYLQEHGHTVVGTTRGPARGGLITMDGLDPDSVKRALDQT